VLIALRNSRRSFLSSALRAASAVFIEPAYAAIPAGSLQASILDAYKAKRGTFVIPAGTYHLEPAAAAGAHLSFHDMNDFEIDARGVELVLANPLIGGVEFVGCHKVRFHGATIRYEIPPFTQGTVESVAPDRKWFTLRIDTGYPANFDDPKFFPAQPIGSLFDARTRNLKSPVYDINASKIERVSGSLFRLYGGGPEGAGDLAAFRGSGHHSISVINCAGMDIRDITIYNSGMFAVLETLGEGGNYYSFQVKRGPRPAGARTDPLYSSSADGFHSTTMRQGPTLENCYFEHMPDDGIAIHGIYSLVLKADGNRFVVNKSSFRPGDPMLLFNIEGSPAGEAVVKAIAPAADFRNTRQSSRKAVANETAGPYFEITLDQSLPAAFDYLCSNPAALGSGYVIRNNTIHQNRARGMLLKAHNGIVEGNIVDGSSVSGIVLSPELWWNEACYSRNVTIRNNTVRNLPDNPRSYGGIVIAAVTDHPVPGYGHQHILLEGNRIESVNGVNLLITSAEDVTVRNNSFVNAQHVVSQPAGAQWGEDSGALVYLTEARDIRLMGNTVSGLGQANRRRIEATSTVSHLESDWT
jgi:hypothetical protein